MAKKIRKKRKRKKKTRKRVFRRVSFAQLVCFAEAVQDEVLARYELEHVIASEVDELEAWDQVNRFTWRYWRESRRED